MIWFVLQREKFKKKKENQRDIHVQQTKYRTQDFNGFDKAFISTFIKQIWNPYENGSNQR